MKKFFGKIVPGRGIGRTMNFPTLNFEIPENLEIKSGVFATRIFLDKKVLPGILFFGNRKTFDNKKSLEIHVLKKFTDSPTSAEFEILKKIREVMKFGSTEKLKKQIEKDCEIARQILEVS